ncbi:MAG: bifunctional folylpolyglutamate synthase/dihydrofolate synthase, partial [Elusimicrobia bacterium]|nr:bifunctional folylpolyglutamate synthase/dihydrofolate synthase [Elusimicrobiota bacterium]
MAKIFTLINIRKVLNELTDAHIKSPVISVAGTNGKGSVAGFIASSLAAEGFSTGLYTSPHIRNFTERIKINGENISNTHLLRLYRKVTREAKGLGVELSKFEKLTGCAILYFEQEKVDVSVMEVGLGGRLDATNVCENRLVSVITKIGEDHMDFLGETIEEIAQEKAGIIKPGRPVVDASATSLIRLAAHKAGSPVFSLGKDFFISNLKSDGRERYEYDFIMGNFTIDKVAPAMSGRHQVDNSAAALACLHLADISRESMRTGITKTRQKGRLEEITLPGDRRFLIDVAHYPDAIIALKKYI